MDRQNVVAKKHRLPPWSYEGKVSVSITACIEDRLRPFKDPSTVEAMIAQLHLACENHLCRVAIYRFMPDHAHVLLQGLSDEARALKAMNQFKEETGRWFASNHPQFEWQTGYHDRIIRAGEFFPAARYILFNPIRAGLVEEPGEYPFTGCIGLDRREALQDIFYGQ
jgi:putative transposase